MKFVNLTPHTINEVTSGRAFEPSGDVARVSVEYIPIDPTDGIDTYAPCYGDVEGLPEPQSGTTFIVSGMVLAHCPKRLDVVAPGELVRDDNGKPIGCKGFKSPIVIMSRGCRCPN